MQLRRPAGVEAWFDGGGDVNVRDVCIYGVTLLIIAALHGREPTVEMLLRRKAAVDLHDHLGGTALMCAALYGYTAIARRLLAAGADTELRTTNVDRNTALQWAQLEGHAECARAIEEHVAPARLAAARLFPLATRTRWPLGWWR